jgi:hypothetical protein
VQLLGANHLFLELIGTRGKFGQKSIRIGQKSNGSRSCGVMRRGYSLGDIRKLGLHVELESQRSIIRLRNRPSSAQDWMDVLGVYIGELRPASRTVLGEGLGVNKLLNWEFSRCSGVALVGVSMICIAMYYLEAILQRIISIIVFCVRAR